MKKKKARKKNTKVNDTRSKVADALKVLGFFLPLACYLVSTLWIWPAPNSGFIAMGFVGAFFVGIGLMTLGSLVNGMYLSKWLTIIFVALGTLLIGISSAIMYIPAVYSQIDEAFVTFYFMMWLFLSISGIWYCFFRGAVTTSLREKGISKTQIEKSMKGMRNYWWYEEIHREFDLKIIFFVNKAFTIIYPAVIVIHFLFGWLKFLSPIIAFLLCVVCPLSSVMGAFLVLYYPSIMRHHPKKQYIWNEVGSVCLAVFPLLMMVAIVIYTLKMWNIT